MPLEMNFSDKFGSDHSNSYWVLVRMNIDIQAGVSVFYFDGYKSKQAFQSGKKPVSTFELLLTEADFNSILPQLDTVVEQVEIKAMTKDFFKTSTKKPKG